MVDADDGEPHQISPLNGPPAPNYFHKGPPGSKGNRASADYAPVTSFFAKILSRPTRALAMATSIVATGRIDLGKEKVYKGESFDAAATPAENELNEQYQSG